MKEVEGNRVMAGFIGDVLAAWMGFSLGAWGFTASSCAPIRAFGGIATGLCGTCESTPLTSAQLAAVVRDDGEP